jgi:putative PIN family toxin of toxin-antitoxin system
VLRLVIDTNVLLDFWVFDDPRARPLRDAVLQARVQCLRSGATDAELADVLARTAFALHRAQRGLQVEAVIKHWQSLAQPVARVFAAPWHCTDPQDQKFLDLAATGRADLLVSKDKALLKVNRRARHSGLAIVPVAAAIAQLMPAATALAAAESTPRD